MSKETTQADTPAPVPLTPTRQYYYRQNGCKAINSDDPDCICWHDEGTGPYANDPYGPKTWRERPAAGTPAPSSHVAGWHPPVGSKRAIVDELKKARSDFMVNDFEVAERILAALASAGEGDQVSSSHQEAFPGATGIGASYRRGIDSWSLYTVAQDGKCERFGSVDGYNRKRIDWVVKTLRAALASEGQA